MTMTKTMTAADYAKSNGLKTTNAAGGKATYPEFEVGGFVDAVLVRTEERKRKEGGGLMRVNTFRLNYSQGVKWMRDKKALPLDEVVSEFVLSGAVLDSALDGRPAGSRFIIEYQGLGEKSGSKSAPKLYKVDLVA